MSVQGDTVAVDLAGAVWAWALDEQDVGVIETSLEVDGAAAGLVQAARVVDVDGLAGTLKFARLAKSIVLTCLNEPVCKRHRCRM